jgi:hypothetical protein
VFHLGSFQVGKKTKSRAKGRGRWRGKASELVRKVQFEVAPKVLAGNAEWGEKIACMAVLLSGWSESDKTILSYWKAGV